MSDRVLIGIHDSQLEQQTEAPCLEIPVMTSNKNNDDLEEETLISNTISNHGYNNETKQVDAVDTYSGDSIHYNNKNNTTEFIPVGMDKPSATRIATDDTTLNDEPKPFIWRSISVHFYALIFLQQILVHCFTPLTIIFSPNPRAQFFWFGLDWTWSQIIEVLVFSLLLNSTTTISIIVYICMYYFEREDYHHFSGSLLFPLLYAMLWRFSIAVRYASFSSEEYQTIMSVTDFKTVRLFQQQTVVNQNYVDWENEQVVDFEIIAASLRVDCNPYECFFTIPNPSDSPAAEKMFFEWKSFLSYNSTTYSSTTHKNEPLIKTDLVTQPNGTYRVSMFHLCKRINRASQREAIKTMAGFNRFIVFVFTCLLIITPFYGFTVGEYPTPSALTISFLILSSWEIALFFYIVLGRFLFGAIIDQRRQAIVAECFGNMLRINDHVDDVLVNFSRPPSVMPRKTSISSSFRQHSNSCSNRDSATTATATQPPVNNTSSFRSFINRHQSKELSMKDHSPKPAISNPIITHNSSKEFRASRQAALARAIFMSNSQNNKATLLKATPSPPSSPTSIRHRKLSRQNSAGFQNKMNDTNNNKDAATSTPATELLHQSNIKNSSIMKNNSNKNTSAVTSKMKRRSFTIYSDSTEKLQKMCSTNQCSDETFEYIADNTYYCQASIPSAATGIANNNKTSCIFSTEETKRLGQHIDVTPRLSFAYPENLFNWVQARLAMQTYKLRFRKRIEATTFFILMATISLVVVLLVLIFLPESQHDKLAQFKTPLFRQTIFSVVIFCLFLILYSFLAAKVNEAYQKHRVLVGKHSLRINEETSYLEGQLVDIEEEQDKRSLYVGSYVGGVGGGKGSRSRKGGSQAGDKDRDADSSGDEEGSNPTSKNNMIRKLNNNKKAKFKNKTKTTKTKKVNYSINRDRIKLPPVEEQKGESSKSSSLHLTNIAVNATIAAALDNNMNKMEDVVGAIMNASSSSHNKKCSTDRNNNNNIIDNSNIINVPPTDEAAKNELDDEIQQEQLLHDNSRLLHRQLVTCHNTAKQLNAVTDLLNITSEVQPMEVFGLKAELSLTVYFISAGVSLFILLLSVYISISQNVNANLV